MKVKKQINTKMKCNTSGCDGTGNTFDSRKTHLSQKYCKTVKHLNESNNNNNNNTLYCGKRAINSTVNEWHLLSDNTKNRNKDKEWKYCFVVIGDGSAEFRVKQIH